jgi:hypothetical protein
LRPPNVVDFVTFLHCCAHCTAASVAPLPLTAGAKRAKKRKEMAMETIVVQSTAVNSAPNTGSLAVESDVSPAVAESEPAKKRAKERDPNKPRRNMKYYYNCRLCGEPKRGHVCPYNLNC